jgi:hypothetical protein
LPLFCIGELDVKDRAINPVSASYRKLNDKLHELNLFDSDYFFYVRELIKFLGLWAGMLYFCILDLHRYLQLTKVKPAHKGNLN